MRMFVAFVALAVTWLLLSGIFDNKLILTFGLLSVTAVLLLMRRMDRIDGAALPYTMGIRPLFYLPWLLLEIVKANLHVCRVVLSPSLPIRQRLVRVSGTQKTDLAKVVYGNSITLTPGTITLDVRDGELLVHALTDVTADGLIEGTMNRKVTELEGLA